MNIITLMGRLTKDVEIRETGTGLKVANFTLAVDRDFVRGDDSPSVDFLNCVAWRQSAEYLEKYSEKGMRVLATGKVQNRSWEDADGDRHYVTEIICDTVKVLDYKNVEEKPAKNNGKYRKK